MSAELAAPTGRQSRAPLLPRFIRGGQAPAYLGMCRAEFDKTVRPHVREFRIGERGVGYDREELDDWATAYVEANAIDKPGTSRPQSAGSERQKGESQWRGKRLPASAKGTESGTSTRKSTVKDFTKALEAVTGRKPKHT